MNRSPSVWQALGKHVRVQECDPTAVQGRIVHGSHCLSPVGKSSLLVDYGQHWISRESFTSSWLFISLSFALCTFSCSIV
mmetsp:Transcript_117158/g.204005  ORF Transcript_117158/g.204005 Transcript_117158/m.204005 type:complete len:80 (-) Transcript_117158:362-601(-)